MSHAESGIAGIETFYAQTPVQVTLTLAGQDANILLNYCNIEDITGKRSTQLNPLSPSGDQHQFSPNHIHRLSRD